MALYIKIRKVSEQSEVGFYHISTKHGGDINFYAGFDKKMRKIYLYLTNDFSSPVRIVNLNNLNEVVGELPGSNVKASILSKVFGAAEEAFELDEFPDYLDYCA